MNLLIQPDDGLRLLVNGIIKATRSVEIVIFRFDQREVEKALANAVTRGVTVRALIAHTNRAGEQNLRKLELRLLAAGVTVARTADDLARYHAKYMLIDRRDLYLLAFNWTHLDIEHSRSFGVITHSRPLVQEAVRIFEADFERRPYEPASGKLVVSPVNARKVLGALIKSAKKELAIYDPKISDPAMLDLLAQRAKAGVQIHILGRITRKIDGVEAHKLSPLRLHTRTILVDRNVAFVGSQSLRALELDARREVGVIFRKSSVVAKILKTFEEDWARANRAAQEAGDEAPAAKVAKRVAKLVAKGLPEVTPVLNGAVKEIVGEADMDLNPEEVEAAVKGAVKAAIKEAVSNMVQDVVEDGDNA